MIVSILIAACNHERFIEAAIASAQRQTHRDLQIIIHDDGSADATANVARRMAQSDPRIRLTRSDNNRGVATARNRLIELARGDFIVFLDSDDFIAADKIEKQVSFLQANPDIVAVGTDCLLVDETAARRLRRDSYPTNPETLFRQPHYCCASIMYRREVLLKAFPVRVGFKRGEDVDLILRVNQLGPVSNLNEPLYFYRQHPNQLSRVSSEHSELVIAMASHIYRVLGHEDIVRPGRIDHHAMLRRLLQDKRKLLVDDFAPASIQLIMHAARRCASPVEFVEALLFCSLTAPHAFCLSAVRWLHNRRLSQLRQAFS